MINIESIKGKIRSMADKKNLKSQEVLQIYFFERFLERLSKSQYKNNFVIKGGFLISSIIGIENRTTMDMDTTIKGIRLKEEKNKRNCRRNNKYQCRWWYKIWNKRHQLYKRRGRVREL